MVKEVNEAAAEYLVSDKRDCVPNEDEESTIRSSNSVTNSKFHLNLWQQDTWISSEQVDELRKNENDQPQQDNWIAFEQVDEICKNENEQPPQDNWIPPAQVDVLSKNKNDRLAIEPTNSTNMPYVHAEHIFNEPDFPSEPCQQEQISISATNSLSHFSSEEEATLSFGTARDKMDTHVHDDTPQDDSQLENCFRAAPLSNRERLILRKQALKMRKRPVLAVGRSNIVTGVAKTIKTYFEKHPLAIVNIKGRADGTSVQEVIFELEQATGAVLVSREPNKVILYRGWGEGEAPPGGTPREKKDARKGSWRDNEEEVSPKLMDAIRVECGLSIGRLE